MAAIAAMQTVLDQLRVSLAHESSKVFFRREDEIRACVESIGKLERAIEELS